MLLLQKGVQLPHGRALTGFRNSIGSSNSSLSTNKSEGQRNPLDCSENHGKRPQFHSSCFQTGPEKILLSTPQVSFRASFSGGQTRSPVSTFQQANAMRSQTDDVAKAPLTFIRLRKPPSLITVNRAMRAKLTGAWTQRSSRFGIPAHCSFIGCSSIPAG